MESGIREGKNKNVGVREGEQDSSEASAESGRRRRAEVAHLRLELAALNTKLGNAYTYIQDRNSRIDLISTLAKQLKEDRKALLKEVHDLQAVFEAQALNQGTGPSNPGSLQASGSSESWKSRIRDEAQKLDKTRNVRSRQGEAKRSALDLIRMLPMRRPSSPNHCEPGPSRVSRKSSSSMKMTLGFSPMESGSVSSMRGAGEEILHEEHIESLERELASAVATALEPQMQLRTPALTEVSVLNAAGGAIPVVMVGERARELANAARECLVQRDEACRLMRTLDAELRQQASDYEAERAYARDDTYRLNKLNTELKNELVRLAAELQSKERQVALYGEEVHQCRREWDNMLGQLRAREIALAERAASLQTERELLTKQIEHGDERTKGLNNDVEELEQSLVKAQEMIRERDLKIRSLLDLAARYRDQRDETWSECSEAKTMAAHMEAARENFEHAMRKHKKETCDLKTTLAERESRLSNLEAEIGTHSLAVQSASAEMSCLQKELVKAHHEAESLQAQLHNEKKERDRLRTEIERGEREIERLVSETVRLRQKVDEVLHEMEVAKAAAEASAEATQQLAEEREALAEEAAALRGELAFARDDAHTIAEEARNLREALRLAEMSISSSTTGEAKGTRELVARAEMVQTHLRATHEQLMALQTEKDAREVEWEKLTEETTEARNRLNSLEHQLQERDTALEMNACVLSGMRDAFKELEFDRGSIMARVDELMDDLRERDCQIGRFAVEAVQFLKEWKDLAHVARERGTALHRLQKQLKERGDLRRLAQNEQVLQLQSQLDSALVKLRESEEELKVSREKVQQLQQKQKMLQADTESFRLDLQAALSDAASDRSKHAAEVSKLMEEIAILKETVEKRVGMMELREPTSPRKTGIYSALSKTLKTVSEMIQKYEQDNVTLRGVVDDLPEQDITNLHDIILENKTLKIMCEKQSIEVEALRKTLDSLQVEVNEMIERDTVNRKLISDLSHLQFDHEKHAAELLEQMDCMLVQTSQEVKKSEEISELQLARQRIQYLEEHITELQSRDTKAHRKMMCCDEVRRRVLEIAKLKQQVILLTEVRNSQSSHILQNLQKNLQEEINAWRVKQNDFYRERQACIKEREKFDKFLKDLTVHSTFLDRDIRHLPLSVQIDELRNFISRLRAENASLKSKEAKETKYRIAVNNNDVQILRDENARLKRYITTLAETIASQSTDESIKNLTLELQATRVERDKLYEIQEKQQKEAIILNKQMQDMTADRQLMWLKQEVARWRAIRNMKQAADEDLLKYSKTEETSLEQGLMSMTPDQKVDRLMEEVLRLRRHRDKLVKMQSMAIVERASFNEKLENLSGPGREEAIKLELMRLRVSLAAAQLRAPGDGQEYPESSMQLYSSETRDGILPETVSSQGAVPVDSRVRGGTSGGPSRGWITCGCSRTQGGQPQQQSFMPTDNHNIQEISTQVGGGTASQTGHSQQQLFIPTDNQHVGGIASQSGEHDQDGRVQNQIDGEGTHSGVGQQGTHSGVGQQGTHSQVGGGGSAQQSQFSSQMQHPGMISSDGGEHSSRHMTNQNIGHGSERKGETTTSGKSPENDQVCTCGAVCPPPPSESSQGGTDAGMSHAAGLPLDTPQPSDSPSGTPPSIPPPEQQQAQKGQYVTCTCGRALRRIEQVARPMVQKGAYIQCKCGKTIRVIDKDIEDVALRKHKGVVLTCKCGRSVLIEEQEKRERPEGVPVITEQQAAPEVEKAFEKPQVLPDKERRKEPEAIEEEHEPPIVSKAPSEREVQEEPAKEPTKYEKERGAEADKEKRGEEEKPGEKGLISDAKGEPGEKGIMGEEEAPDGKSIIGGEEEEGTEFLPHRDEEEEMDEGISVADREKEEEEEWGEKEITAEGEEGGEEESRKIEQEEEGEGLEEAKDWTPEIYGSSEEEEDAFVEEEMIGDKGEQEEVKEKMGSEEEMEGEFLGEYLEGEDGGPGKTEEGEEGSELDRGVKDVVGKGDAEGKPIVERPFQEEEGEEEDRFDQVSRGRDEEGDEMLKEGGLMSEEEGELEIEEGEEEEKGLSTPVSRGKFDEEEEESGRGTPGLSGEEEFGESGLSEEESYIYSPAMQELLKTAEEWEGEGEGRSPTPSRGKMGVSPQASKVGASPQASKTGPSPKGSKVGAPQTSTAGVSAQESKMGPSAQESKTQPEFLGEFGEGEEEEGEEEEGEVEDEDEDGEGRSPTASRGKMGVSPQASKKGASPQASKTGASPKGSKVDASPQASKAGVSAQASKMGPSAQESKTQPEFLGEFGEGEEREGEGRSPTASRVSPQASKMGASPQASKMGASPRSSKSGAAPQASKSGVTPQASKVGPSSTVGSKMFGEELGEEGPIFEEDEERPVSGEGEESPGLVESDEVSPALQELIKKSPSIEREGEGEEDAGSRVYSTEEEEHEEEERRGIDGEKMGEREPERGEKGVGDRERRGEDTGTLAQLRAEKEKCAEQLEALRREKENLERELNQLRNQPEEKTFNQMTPTEQVDYLKSELDDLKRRLQEAQDELKRCREDNLVQKSSSKRFDDMMSRMTPEERETINKMLEREREKGRAEGEAANREKMNSAFTGEQQKVRQDADNDKKRQQDMHDDQLDEYRDQIKELEDKLKALERGENKEIDEMRKRAQADMQSEIAQLRTEQQRAKQSIRYECDDDRDSLLRKILMSETPSRLRMLLEIARPEFSEEDYEEMSNAVDCCYREIRALLKKASMFGLESLTFAQLARLHDAVRETARRMRWCAPCEPNRSATCDDMPPPEVVRLVEDLAREDAATSRPEGVGMGDEAGDTGSTPCLTTRFPSPTERKRQMRPLHTTPSQHYPCAVCPPKPKAAVRPCPLCTCARGTQTAAGDHEPQMPGMGDSMHPCIHAPTPEDKFWCLDTQPPVQKRCPFTCNKAPKEWTGKVRHLQNLVDRDRRVLETLRHRDEAVRVCRQLSRGFRREPVNEALAPPPVPTQMPLCPTSLTTPCQRQQYLSEQLSRAMTEKRELQTKLKLEEVRRKHLGCITHKNRPKECAISVPACSGRRLR